MSAGTRQATAPPAKRAAVTLSKLGEKKALGEPIVMVTAYDHPSAQVAEAAGVQPEYLSLVDPESLAPVPKLGGRVLAVVAARVGPARLIDNLPLDLEPVATP